MKPDAVSSARRVLRGPSAVDLAVAAASGALTLVDPARLGLFGRLTFRTSQAAVVGALTWTAAKEVPGLEWQPETRVATTAGAIAVTFAFAEVGEALDAVAVRALSRRGVTRPRLAVAAGAVALALGLSVLDRSVAQQRADADADGTVDVPVLRPLPEPVRAIIAAILDQTEDHDSRRLRAQLGAAREESWSEVEEFVPMIELAVPEDVPLAVPHTFTFPVSAHFRSTRGVPCAVQLLVAGGRLSALVIDVYGPAWDEMADDWDDEGDADPLVDVTAWPALGELAFVTESPGRP